MQIVITYRSNFTNKGYTAYLSGLVKDRAHQLTDSETWMFVQCDTSDKVIDSKNNIKAGGKGTR